MDYPQILVKRQKKIECLENWNAPWKYPVRTIRDTLLLTKAKKMKFDSKPNLDDMKITKEVNPPKATALLNFFSSLPRSIRWNGRYQQWEDVMKFADAKVKENYLALLNAALRLKLKMMFTPHDPQNNPYAQLLWNLSKTSALRDPASVALNRCRNANLQFKAWVNQCFFAYPFPD